MNTAWKLAIFFAVVFMFATTIQDMNQNNKIAELQKKLDALETLRKSKGD